MTEWLLIWWPRSTITPVSCLDSSRRGEEQRDLPAVQTLLARFDLAGTVVTVDAIHTQTDTAQLIVDARGDYVFTVKGNRPALLRVLQSAAVARRPGPPRHRQGHRRTRAAAPRSAPATRPG